MELGRFNLRKRNTEPRHRSQNLTHTELPEITTFSQRSINTQGFIQQGTGGKEGLRAKFRHTGHFRVCLYTSEALVKYLSVDAKLTIFPL